MWFLISISQQAWAVFLGAKRIVKFIGKETQGRIEDYGEAQRCSLEV